MTITIVSGPPCAGKSTYIVENSAAGDVIVDMDLLLSAFGGERLADGDLARVVLAARSAAIDTILSGIDADSWIIDTNLLPDSVARYEDAGALFIALDPGMDVCLARAAERPEGTEDLIRDWYAQRQHAKRLVRDEALVLAHRYPHYLEEILSVVKSAVGRL